MAHSLYKTFYDLSRLVFWAETHEDEKRARLTLGFRDGNPRFTVNTGLAKGAEGMIVFPCDPIHLTTAMIFLEDIANGTYEGERVLIESLAPANYTDGKPSKEKLVKATLYAGKTKEGIIYLSVVADKKPKIIFPMKMSDFHVTRNGDKTPVPEPEVSKRIALATAYLVKSVVANAILEYAKNEYEEGERKPFAITDNYGDKKAGGKGSAKGDSKFDNVEEMIL